MEKKHYSDIRREILDNYKNMSEREMFEALARFAEAINDAAIEQVKTAIYWIAQNK